MAHKKKKIDVVFIALVLVLVVILMTVYTRKPSFDDANKITSVLMDESNFAGQVVIDPERMNQLTMMNYDELKEYLGVTKDFCFYMEDEGGNLIFAKGSEKLSKDGIYCK